MRKIRDKERTKIRIIENAIEVFVKEGFINANTKSIAKKSGIAHGTIFYHYPTRADLVIASIYTELEVLGNRLNMRSRESEDVQELCSLFIDEVLKHQKFYSRLVKDLPLLSIEVQRIVFASLSGFSVHFIDVIEKMQEKGKVRKVPAKIPVFFWFGVINYIFSYDELLQGKKILKKDKNEIIAFFLNGLSV